MHLGILIGVSTRENVAMLPRQQWTNQNNLPPTCHCCIFDDPEMWSPPRDDVTAPPPLDRSGGGAGVAAATGCRGGGGIVAHAQRARRPAARLDMRMQQQRQCGQHVPRTTHAIDTRVHTRQHATVQHVAHEGIGSARCPPV